MLRTVAIRSAWFSDISRVGLLTAIVKLAGGIKTALSARVFGLSGPLDAYLSAFFICSFVCDSLAGTMPPALIPLFVQRMETSGREELHACYRSALCQAVLFLSIISAVILGCRGLLLHVLAPGFSPKQLELTSKLLLLLAPMFPMMGATAVFRSMLHSQSHFAIVAIAPVMTPLFATILLLFAHSRGGIYILAIGSTLGVFAETLILAFYLLFLRMPILPVFGAGLMNLQCFKRNYIPLVFSNVLHGGVTMIDQGVASLFAAGSVSILALGTRLASVVMAIAPATLSTVILPKLSRMVAMKDWESVQLAIKRWLLLGCVAGVLLTSLLMMISGPIARLIFQKIVSSAADIQMLNVVQLLSLLQLPFVMSAVVVGRAVLALQLNRKLVSLSVLALTTNAVFDVALVRPLGISGIIVSTVLVQVVTLFILFRIVRGFLIARVRPALQFDSRALEGID